MYYENNKTTCLRPKVTSNGWFVILNCYGGYVLHGLQMTHGNTDLTLIFFSLSGTHLLNHPVADGAGFMDLRNVDLVVDRVAHRKSLLCFISGKPGTFRIGEFLFFPYPQLDQSRLLHPWRVAEGMEKISNLVQKRAELSFGSSALC